MSTRGVYNFRDEPDGEVIACIYKHTDNYPEGKHGGIATIQDFFSAVERQTKDTRFDDPAYLAAKFVVYIAGEYADELLPLNFISLGIVPPGEDYDQEYVYDIICNNGTSRPGYRVRPA